MNKISTKALFVIMAIFAFGGFISFFQINSYWADQHNFNGVFGWLGIGIVLILVAAGLLAYIAWRSGGSNKLND